MGGWRILVNVGKGLGRGGYGWVYWRVWVEIF